MNVDDRRIGRLIQSLRDALSTHKPPYCTGTVQIPQDQYTLYYGPKGNAQYVKYHGGLIPRYK